MAVVVILSCWQPSLAMAQGIQQVQHIVFIIKENHTYDNYFGQFPGGNDATTGVLRGKKVPLTHAADSAPDLCHLRKCAWEDYGYGAMDKFDFGVSQWGSSPATRNFDQTWVDANSVATAKRPFYPRLCYD